MSLIDIYLSVLSFHSYPINVVRVSLAFSLAFGCFSVEAEICLKRKVNEQEIVRWRINVGQIKAFIRRKTDENQIFALNPMIGSESSWDTKGCEFCTILPLL